MLAFVDSRLHDRAASEDTVQETFIGFLTSLPHYDEDRDLEAYLFSIAAHKLTDHLRKQGRRPIDQFGSDDQGRPLEEVPGPIRAASSIARSDERRQAEEQLLADSLGRLVGEWLDRGDFTRLRCLELLIVKGWANKDVAQVPRPDRAGGCQLQVPDRQPPQGHGPPRRDERRGTPELVEPAGSPTCPSPSTTSSCVSISPRAYPATGWPAWRRPCATPRSFASGWKHVRQDRPDATLHTLGAIWRRNRLTCLSREQLGSYLLDVLDPEQSEYVTFHLEVIECPFCLANLADLKGKADALGQVHRDPPSRIFHSSRHLLSGEE